MDREKEIFDSYLDTVKRLEPEISMIDPGAGWASIAISLKRIADSLEPKPPEKSAKFDGFLEGTRAAKETILNALRAKDKASEYLQWHCEDAADWLEKQNLIYEVPR